MAAGRGSESQRGCDARDPLMVKQSPGDACGVESGHAHFLDRVTAEGNGRFAVYVVPFQEPIEGRDSPIPIFNA